MTYKFWNLSLAEQREGDLEFYGEDSHGIPKLTDEASLESELNLDPINLGKSIAGSWASYNPVKQSLITSVNFTGAYHDTSGNFSSSISDLLGLSGKSAMLDLDSTRVFLSKRNGSPVQPLACKTPFSKVSFATALTSYSYQPEDGLKISRTALNDLGNLPEISLLDSFLETAALYEKQYSKVGVLFSGGKDSLAVALALRSAMGSERVVCIYILTDGIESGGSLEQARLVAKEYGFELEIISSSFGWPSDNPSDVQEILDSMKHRIMSPFEAQFSVKMKLDCLVSGQNMDSVLSLAIPKPPQFGWMSEPGYRNFLIHRIVLGLPYTSFFANSPILDSSLTGLINLRSKLLRSKKRAERWGSNVNEHVSRLAMASGWTDPDWENRIPDIEASADLISSIIQSRGEIQLHDTVRKSWYYLHPGMAVHMMGVPNSLGLNSRSFVTETPFLRHWIKPVPIKNIFNKKPLEDVVYQISGVPWRNVAKSGFSLDRGIDGGNEISKQFFNILSSENLAIYDHINGAEFTDLIKSKIEFSNLGLSSKKVGVTFRESNYTEVFNLAARLTNLELILRNA
jgi:hypothetical protein